MLLLLGIPPKLILSLFSSWPLIILNKPKSKTASRAASRDSAPCCGATSRKGSQWPAESKVQDGQRSKVSKPRCTLPGCLTIRLQLRSQLLATQWSFLWTCVMMQLKFGWSCSRFKHVLLLEVQPCIRHVLVFLWLQTNSSHTHQFQIDLHQGVICCSKDTHGLPFLDIPSVLQHPSSAFEPAVSWAMPITGLGVCEMSGTWPQHVHHRRHNCNSGESICLPADFIHTCHLQRANLQGDQAGTTSCHHGRSRPGAGHRLGGMLHGAQYQRSDHPSTVARGDHAIRLCRWGYSWEDWEEKTDPTWRCWDPSAGSCARAVWWYPAFGKKVSVARSGIL